MGIGLSVLGVLMLPDVKELARYGAAVTGLVARLPR
jgi:hypothetical protein